MRQNRGVWEDLEAWLRWVEKRSEGEQGTEVGVIREKAGEQGGQGQALVGLVRSASSLRFISVLKVKPPIILNKGWPRPLFGRIMSESSFIIYFFDTQFCQMEAGQWLYLSEPQFPELQNGAVVPCLLGWSSFKRVM